MKKQAQKPKLGQAPLVTPIKMQVRRPSFPFPAFPRVVSIIAVSAIIAHIVSVYLLLRLFDQKHSAVYPFNLPHPGGRLRLKDVVLGNDKRSAREFFFNHLDDFCNECDFEFYRRYLRRIPCCNSGADFVIGGLNEGDLSDVFLERCTGHIHGFEIQKHYFEQLLLKYAAVKRRITVNFKGMSNKVGEAPVTGELGGAGLYTSWTHPHSKKEYSWDGTTTVPVVDISSYLKERVIQNVCVAVFDVEGHEPQAIQGITQGFIVPFLVYEVGGAHADQRSSSTWSQTNIAEYLQKLGYLLFMMGKRGLLEVEPSFFTEAAAWDEGFGRVVNGNVMAIHKSAIL